MTLTIEQYTAGVNEVKVPHETVLYLYKHDLWQILSPGFTREQCEALRVVHESQLIPTVGTQSAKPQIMYISPVVGNYTEEDADEEEDDGMPSWVMPLAVLFLLVAVGVVIYFRVPEAPQALDFLFNGLTK